MKDVASAAGVSTQTVSRVVNEHPDVARETRKQVQDIIEKVGYRPNVLARSLISQRSYTLGVVIAGLNLIGPSTLLNGITSTAENSGYSLILKELPRFETDNVEPIFHALLARQVDGIIWAVPEVGENRKWLRNFHLDYNIPLVYVTMEPQEGITTVSINNYLGGRLATSHLIEQGFRRIGHLSGPLSWWEARQRMLAWKDVLTDAGIDISDQHWASGNWSTKSGYQAIQQLLEQYPDMDSIFIGNDQMALGALQYIHQRGLKVPEDISIVGFDNILESPYFWPALSTIQQNQGLVGQSAVNEVVRLIQSDWQGMKSVNPKSILLDPTLVVRRSSTLKENAILKEVRTNKGK